MWFVHDWDGIQLEEDYPYISGGNTANKDCWAPYGGPVQVKGVNPVKSYSQDQLMAAIAKGVTSVTIQSASEVFRFYESGVITDESCGTSLDHAVAAVGYGTDENGVDYYLIRNSWGSEWGDHGHVKIGRNGDGYGICGVQEISVWATTN
jgi:C1A family cysteine protease